MVTIAFGLKESEQDTKGIDMISIGYEVLSLLSPNSFANDNQGNNDPFASLSPPILATTVNGISIESDPYITQYLADRNNFQDLDMQTVTADGVDNIEMKSRNAPEQYNRYTINNKNYVIDLIACPNELQTCTFRINGVLASGLTKSSDFNLDNEYKLHIVNIQFNYCDNRRFCDGMYQEYDKLEYEIQKVQS